MKSFREIIEKANLIHDSKYDYSEFIYLGLCKKGIIICQNHGRFFQTLNKHVTNEQGCPRCVGKYKDTPTFILDSEKVHGKLYDYSKVFYINNNVSVIIICKQHGGFLQSYAAHVTQQQKCPKCQQKAKLTINEFIKISNEIHDNKYDYSSFEYINNKTKGNIICHKIGYNGKEHGEFLQTPGHHMHGENGCPKCGESRGESLIEKYLNANHIKYMQEYKFNNCVNIKTKRNLPFDFYLSEYDACIEYDGIYHLGLDFIKTHNIRFPKHHTQENYEKVNFRDNIKTSYCKDNSIPLLRISFWNTSTNKAITKEDIETTIKNFINSLTKV